MRHARPAVIRNLVLPAVAAAATSVFAAAGAPTLTPVPGPTAVVVTTQEPAAEHLAPRCFETSVNGTQDCAWVPVAPCESDEAGDDAVPPSYEGCFWDAGSRDNHAGASYVYWRLNRG